MALRLLATIRPRLPGGSGGTSVALAILGTTLTGYAYTWQVQEEAEAARPWYRARLARVDAVLGTGMAVAVFWFILIATGATLGAHHQQIDTAEQAAEALRPLAGPLAAYVFGIGLLASSFVAVPVLAATTGSVVCQQFGWRAGLDLRPREAPAFYGVMAGSLALAVAISLVAVPPIALLVAASIAGGLATPVGLVFLLLVARDRTAMHGLPVGRGLAAAGWVTTAIVTGVSLLYLWSQIAR
ncbi:MAG TPA: divalent metal cation transporter [Candidatus Dormibacteraeota bacterium]|nr:divalent metal cation transporter [Candidatus Dormibacteraeota bacterium]